MTQQHGPSDKPPDAPHEIRVAFWNLQNLFGVDSSSIASDFNYTPAFGWTGNALEQKIASLAAVINSMFDGTGPDLLGVCEIETEQLADQLLTALDRKDLRLARPATPHTGGLDTALFYSDRMFTCDPKKTRSHAVYQQFPTRDIFEAQLTISGSETELTVLVNHWPSRSPDRQSTDAFRQTVARRCSQLVDTLVKMPRREYLELGDNAVSLFQLNHLWDRNILLMGDFNDEPWDRSLREILNAEFSVRHMDDVIEMLNGSLPSWRTYSSRAHRYSIPCCRSPRNRTRAATFPAQTHALQRGLTSSWFRAGCILAAPDSWLRGLPPAVPHVRVVQPSIMTDKRGRPIPFRVDTLSGFSDHFPIAMRLQPDSS